MEKVEKTEMHPFSANGRYDRLEPVDKVQRRHGDKWCHRQSVRGDGERSCLCTSSIRRVGRVGRTSTSMLPDIAFRSIGASTLIAQVPPPYPLLLYATGNVSQMKKNVS